MCFQSNYHFQHIVSVLQLISHFHIGSNVILQVSSDMLLMTTYVFDCYIDVHVKICCSKCMNNIRLIRWEFEMLFFEPVTHYLRVLLELETQYLRDNNNKSTMSITDKNQTTISKGCVRPESCSHIMHRRCAGFLQVVGIKQSRRYGTVVLTALCLSPCLTCLNLNFITGRSKYVFRSEIVGYPSVQVSSSTDYG